ncbi:MAG: sigma-70 family RNA polymerase sigma factor [Bryobacteraceae bacterium]
MTPPSWIDTPEDELIAAAQSGDRAAFDELIRRNYDASLRLATFLLHSRDDAEDEVQSAYTRAFEAIPSFREQAKFSTWITRIVMNCCLMRIRRVKRARVQSIDDDGGGESMPLALRDRSPDQEAEVGRTQMLDRLRAEIRRIPPLFRDILELRDLEELPFPEVAERLGISVPAAKSRLLRARSELRRRMERHIPGAAAAV